jgi:hypothetical protein
MSPMRFNPSFRRNSETDGMAGPLRDLLIGVEVRQAGRRRKCGRNAKHQIRKGEPCLVVKRQGRGERAYCAECASMLLDQVELKISQLRDSLV